jgi:hypothetical protein
MTAICAMVAKRSATQSGAVALSNARQGAFAGGTVFGATTCVVAVLGIPTIAR